MSEQNVDFQEIDKFSQLAEKWWDMEGEFKPLHMINPLRLDFIKSHVAIADKTIVDVGCGGGILTEALAREAKAVLGIDLAEKSLEVAKVHAQISQLNNIDYQCIAVEQLAWEQAAQFDVVVCMEMLEHVPDPESIIRSCARLAKPQSPIFFSTLSRNSKSYLEAIIAAEYLLGLVPKGTHDYNKFIKPSELARMCRNCGLEVEALTGMTYNPITQVYSLCGSTQVNYMMVCRKLA